MKRKTTIALAGVMAMSVSLAEAAYKMHVWQGKTETTFDVPKVDSLTFTYYEAPSQDAESVMKSDAKTLAKKIFAGVNIGNTLESTDNGGGWCPDGETCWGAARVTPAYMKAIKNAGFNAVRLPIQWHGMEVAGTTTYEIKPAWLNRVKEIVQFAVDEDLYVIVNIHWDQGWLEENVSYAKQADVNKEQEALWRQIANLLNEFDEHVLFASANEPGMNTSGDATEMATVLKSYHQTFVNTVRSTGGNNALRNLIVQGIETDCEKAVQYDVVPTDIVENRMMFECHFYPYSYALMEEDQSWGNMFFFWGNTDEYRDIYINGINRSVGANGWCNEAYIDRTFRALKEKFVDGLGMPIVMGEYCVLDRDLSSYGNNINGKSYQQLFEESRAYYYDYVTKAMKDNGIIPFLWETPGNIFNRGKDTSVDYSILHQEALDGIISGATKGVYPF